MNTVCVIVNVLLPILFAKPPRVVFVVKVLLEKIVIYLKRNSVYKKQRLKVCYRISFC